MEEHFDVIISGAGPAGCTAALALGSSGLKTLLVEKKKFPREKICGDAIPAYVPKVLRTINHDYAEAFEKLTPGKKVNTCRIVAPDKNILDLVFPEYGFICKRIDLDNFLFRLVSEISDIKILQGTDVKDVQADDDYFTVKTGNGLSLKSRLIIGCDGATSSTREKLSGVKYDPASFSFAVRTYFRNVKDIPEETFELHYLKDYLPGYLWIFPLPGNISNAGLGIPFKMIAEKKINPKKEFLKIIDNYPGIKERFSDAEMVGSLRGSLLPLCFRKNEISGAGFMLCGDAALLADPFTGGGIGQAMISGRYAGWHARECFKNNDFSKDFMKKYDDTLYQKIWKENKSHLIIRNLIFKYPGRINAVVKAGSGNTTIGKAIVNFLK